jgi:molybdopterin-dependent oxidoreductase iron-sulfur protein
MASASERRTVVRAACPHDCPDTCAMLVTVEDGRAVAVRGDPEHPRQDPRRNGLFSIDDGFRGSGRLDGGVRSQIRTGLRL